MTRVRASRAGGPRGAQGGEPRGPCVTMSLSNISLSCHFVIHFVGPLRPGRGAGCGRPDGDGTATTVAGDAEEGGTFDRNDRTSKRRVMTDTHTRTRNRV